MILETWFPIPIMYDIAPLNIKEAIFNEYKLAEKEIVSKTNLMCVNNKNSVNWNDNVYSTFKTITNVISEYSLRNLEQYIFFVTSEYIKHLDTNLPKLNIVESFVNYNNKNQYQNWHNHYPSYISGVYYLNTNGQDGDLVFRNPMIYPSIVNNNSTILTNESIKYQPEPGKIILFPGHIEHSVSVNMTDHTRISLSFNISIN